MTEPTPQTITSDQVLLKAREGAYDKARQSLLDKTVFSGRPRSPEPTEVLKLAQQIEQYFVTGQT